MTIYSIYLSYVPSLTRFHPKITIRLVSKFSSNDIFSDYTYGSPKHKLHSHSVDVIDKKNDNDLDNYSLNRSSDESGYKSLYEEENTRGEKHQEALQMGKKYGKKILNWRRNAKKPERAQDLDCRGRSYGRGGRKSASARVWIYPGDGIVTINRRTFLDYFPRESHRELIVCPFLATQTCGLFDTLVTVEGGGLTGQASAICHGLSRALEKYNPDFRPVLKQLGFLTRDSRVVERKKIGLKKARKAPQWVRR